MSNNEIPSPVLAGDAIHRALSLFIGRGRKYQVNDIAIGTAIPERTVSSWLASDPLDRRAPKGFHLLIMCSFLGTGFSSKVLGSVGQGAHSLDPETGNPCVVVSTLMTGAAKFASLAVDGKYCNVDKGELEPFADDMIATLTPFSTKTSA